MRYIEITEAKLPGMPRIRRADVQERIEQIGLSDDPVSVSDMRHAFDQIMSAAEFQNKKMVIYRGMYIEEPEWFENLRPGENLGRYWAYDIQGALDGSFDKPNVILTALVNPKDIDWTTSIAQQIAVGEEYEITLGGAQVMLMNYPQAKDPWASKT